MDLIERSIEIALEAYTGLKDKAGKTYILHPLRVMNRMQSDEEMAVALLHDVLEDSKLTERDLLDKGIPAYIVDAVRCLTKAPGENYDDFIIRVSKSQLAMKVKIADIEDNINVLRLDVIERDDLNRITKYHRAWKRLHELRIGQALT